MKRVLFVGHAQHGKDTACEVLAAATGWTNAGTTSLYLAKHVAARLGISVEDAYAQRRRSEADRMLWRQIGDEVRQTDPALLVRDALAVGPITGGCRGLPEIEAVRREGLVDLIVWVDASKRKPWDVTMEFGPEHADVIVNNNGSEEEFQWRIRRLAAVIS